MDELKELYDEADKVEDGLLALRDEVDALDYSDDRAAAEDCLEEALDALQRAMQLMDSSRWRSERG